MWNKVRNSAFVNCLLVLSCVSIAFGYGVAVGTYHVFPFSILKFVQDSVAQLFEVSVTQVPHWETQNRAQLMSLWNSFPVERGQIVFLGDSITQRGRWSEFFPQLDVRNFGIDGDTTEGVLDRLYQVTQGHPAVVFLMIGINDLAVGIPPNMIEARYAQVLDRLTAESPETRVFVQSVLPAHSAHEKSVIDLNQRVRRLAEARKLPYLDLYPHFVCEDGSICNDYSIDELHLLWSGYVNWTELLRPYISVADN